MIVSDKVNLVERMPLNGQFIRVWRHNNVLWCRTMRRNHDQSVIEYDHGNDMWRPVSNVLVDDDIVGYIILNPKEKLK
jgi:hypothetical protein